MLHHTRVSIAFEDDSYESFDSYMSIFKSHISQLRREGRS
jgi:hypothetical protein